MNNKKVVPFNAPLNELDTETQTFGCRQNNPDICSGNSIPGFVLLHQRMGFVKDHQEHGRRNITN